MRWPFQQYVGWLSALLMAVYLAAAIGYVVLFCGCGLPEKQDYMEPAVGFTGAAAVEMCRQDRYLPCGWVYNCGDHTTQWCLPWPDRIGPYPYKLLEMCESLYGQCELADDARYQGTPICYYHCDPSPGCNASSGCFCLDGQ